MVRLGHCVEDAAQRRAEVQSASARVARTPSGHRPPTHAQRLRPVHFRGGVPAGSGRRLDRAGSQSKSTVDAD